MSWNQLLKLKFSRQKKSNIIVAVIYRHPSMDLTYFNCSYLNKLLENTSKEQKSAFLLGDFNINLLIYNEHNSTSGFLESLDSIFRFSHFCSPSLICSNSKYVWQHCK